MTIQATYLTKKWEISATRVAALGSLSTACEVKRVSDSANGKSKITGLELQRLTLDYVTTFESGGSPRKEFEEWEDLVGQCGELRIGGRRFGPANFQLRSVSMQDALVDQRGRIRRATIALSLVEYVPPESGVSASTGTGTSHMQILYKGRDIYPQISVTSCEHDMHAESQADSLVLRFNDPNRLWDSWSVAQESTIEVIEGAARTGKMYIYDLTPQNGTYTLKAFSIPPTSKNRTAKSWEKVRFKQLCREIAERHGLDYEEHGVTDQVYEYVVQDNVPDFVFLEQRCKLEGCSFLVFNGKLVVYGEQKMEAQTPQKLLKLGTDSKFSYADDTSKAYKTCILVNATHVGEYTAPTESGTRILSRNTHVLTSSQEEANRYAKNLLRLENKRQWTGTLEMDIQRDLAPGSVVQIKTVGASSFDGRFFIYRVRHDFKTERSKIFARKRLEY